MDRAKQRRDRRIRAHRRLRRKIEGTAERPRLSVFRSLRYVYAQLIDDASGKTVAQANSREAELAAKLEGGAGTKAAARLVGETVADRAQALGVESVVFDRGGNIYHGRVQEVAEGARSKGLRF